MNVEIVVPWRGGCEHRERAWRWVQDQLPFPYRVGEGGTPWIKADAIAAARSTAEILVIHDADVFCEDLEAAVEAVVDGAGWAMPHKSVLRLSQTGTAALLSGAPWRGIEDYDQPPYRGVEGGGIVVLRRETLEEIPIDSRFVGWSGEDISWAMALNTLVGPPWRGDGHLVHCWHPPQDRLSRKWGSLQARALARRYQRARRDPEQMRSLLSELAELDQPTRSDPHPV